jgi:hypothetical protein
MANTVEPKTDTKPGAVILLGSGETLPSSGVIHEYALQELPQPPRIAILETPAGFEPNSMQVAGKIKDFMARRLQNYKPLIEVIPARRKGTPFSPDEAEIVSPILEADEVLLGPGSPTYAVRQLRDSLALHMIAARHRRGGTVFLSSAATLAFGTHTLPVYEIYKVGEDLHWVPGLDFFHPYGLELAIIPHWNNRDGGEELDTSHCYMGRKRFESLFGILPPGQTVVGIDEHTGLILDFEQGCCHVRGSDTVTLLRGGEEKVYPSGSAFPLEALGNCHLPDKVGDIPTAVWESALQVEAEREARVQKPQPGAEVLALLQAREAARSQKDWEQADVLRNQVAALGWQINDTAEGSQLVHLEP